MKRTGGFVDLRIQPNSRSSLSDDSVWPSFTDIMTVVVMIFLMALVVIMIRNTELGQQLQQKSEEISVIDTQKQETQSHRETLAVRLNQVQRQLNELNKRLAATRRERDETQATLVVNLQQARELKAQIEALKVLRSKLVGENEALTRDKEGLGIELARVKQESRESGDKQEEQISELTRQVLSLEAVRERLLAETDRLVQGREALGEVLATVTAQSNKEKARQEERLSALTQQLQALLTIRKTLAEQNQAMERKSAIAAEKLAAAEWALQEKVVALAKAEETIVTTTTERKTMEGEFSDLKTKYNKLIRPARSDIGRHVVALLYRKRGGQEQYELKLPQEHDFRVVTKPQLHSELASLKQQYGDKLYTKIIIPDDSGLSFSQAWKFQLDIFNKYDYYYQ